MKRRMKVKKIISIIVCIAVILTTFAGCSISKKAQLGETVSTDIVSFKLNYAKMSIYAKTYKSNGFASFLPSDTELTGETETANKGKTFVLLDYSLTNLDRTKILNFVYKVYVVYKGERYEQEGYGAAVENIDNYTNYIYEDSSKYPYIAPLNNSPTGSKTSYWCDTNETWRYRDWREIDTDVESLDDTFDIIVEIKNSKGEFEEFEYKVSSDDISTSLYDIYYKTLVSPESIFEYSKSFDAMSNAEITKLLGSLSEETPCVEYEGWTSPDLVKFVKKGSSFTVSSYDYVSSNYYERWKKYTNKCVIKNSKISIGSSKDFANMSVKKLNDSWYLFENGKCFWLINKDL